MNQLLCAAPALKIDSYSTGQKVLCTDPRISLQSSQQPATGP